MSQAKVDRYKKEKANRKQIMKREKLRNLLRRCVVGLAALLLVGWVGYSAYGTYEKNRPKEEAEIDYTAFDELTQKLSDAAAQEAE